MAARRRLCLAERCGHYRVAAFGRSHRFAEAGTARIGRHSSTTSSRTSAFALGPAGRAPPLARLHVLLEIGKRDDVMIHNRTGRPLSSVPVIDVGELVSKP